MYEKRILPNGIRILSEHMEGIRSCAVGVWVESGSRDETLAEHGSAHFIEHMAFKGSEKMNAAALAKKMDLIGGQVDAFTTRECTCFHARVLDAHLPQLLDVLSTLVLEPKFAPEDTETERGVILEEMGMYRDEPDDLVSEQLMTAVYKGNPICRPILGSEKSVSTISADALRDWRERHYSPDKMVIAIAGSFDDSFLREIADRFSVLQPQKTKKRAVPVYHPACVLRRKKTEQNHMILAWPGLPDGDPCRFTMQMLSSILGGGMSSRLFQEVREKRGLCYTVSAYPVTYTDSGMLNIYTATAAESGPKAATAIRDVLRSFVDAPVTPEELEVAREEAKAGILMSLESTAARMSRLANSEVFLRGSFLTPEEVITRCDAVTAEDVLNLARDIFVNDAVSLSVVGRIPDRTVYENLKEQLKL